MDFKDLKRLTVECEGWIRTARLLIQDVMGDDFVFEDASAGVKKGTDRVGSTDSKTTVVEVRIIFHLTFDLFGMYTCISIYTSRSFSIWNISSTLLFLSLLFHSPER